MLNKKWYPSQSPAKIIKNAPDNWPVAYHKYIKDSCIPGGRIVANVIGRSKAEAEEIAKHICDLHNASITK